ncbi:MAG TPA: polysaccharide biosynthesis protein [Pseudonocardiaceae bacterium]
MPQAARLPAALVRTALVRMAQRARVEAVLVSAALFGANALSYLLNMLAARALAPDVYGTLGSLLAVIVVGAVPAMGMQTVAALHVARAATGAADGVVSTEQQLLRTGLGGATVVGLLAVVATPLLVALLHLPSGWPVVWLGVALAPLTLLGVFHGVLQGRRRFAMLALLVGVEGVGKVGGALTGLFAFHSLAATLAGMAAGAVLAAGAGWWVCGRRRPQRSPVALAGEVLHASQAILGLVLLVNLDIVLARHNLSGAQAGDYAVGVIITKIAYWLPQAVAVIVLPRFVDERHRRRAVPIALAVIALLDAWVVLPTLLYGPAIIRLIGGTRYGEHVTAAWLFALLGSLLALVQLLLYSRIASADRRCASAVWAAVIIEILLVTIWLDDSVTAVASAALTSVALLVLAGLAIEYRTARRPLGLLVPGEQ